jgi:hypothetical protein
MGRFFRVHRNKPWMKQMLNRIKEERALNQTITKNTIMDIFPEPSRTCTPGFKKRDQKCTTLLYEIWDLGMVKDIEINPDTIEDVLDLYSYHELSS